MNVKNVDSIIAALRLCKEKDSGYGAPDEIYQAEADKLGWKIWQLIRVYQLSNDSAFKFEPAFIEEAVRVAGLPKPEFKKATGLQSTHWLDFTKSLKPDPTPISTNTQLEITVMTSNFIQSGPRFACPVCGRTHDDGCSIAKDGKTVLCRSKAHNGQLPEPPDEVNGWKFTGKVNGSGVLERAVYVADTWQKPTSPKSEFTFDYPDGDGNPCVRTRRVDKGDGKKLVWQEYWIEDSALSNFTVSGHWIKMGKGKGTASERALYEQHRTELAKQVHLFKIDEALALHQATGHPLFVVEGETSCLALLKINIPATTAIGGAGKFEQYGWPNYLADLEPFTSVVVCPDCDEDGRKHAEGIVRHRPDARWLYANPAHARWQAQSWVSGYDVGNWIADGATADQILAAVEDKRVRVTEDSVAVESEATDDRQEIKYELGDDAATPDHHLNKYFFKEGKGDYCTIDGAWFRHEAGEWVYQPDDRMQKVITGQLKKLYVKKSEKRGDDFIERHIHKFGVDKHRNSVFRFNQSDLSVPADERPNPNRYLNFLNGVLDVEANKFISYDRSLYLTSQIQANYTIGGDCPSDFQAFIDKAYGREKTELIRAVVRYYLDPSLPYNYFVHLLGTSGSGKGTLIRFIGSLLGKSYKALSEFSALNSPESRHQHLTGARMVAFPDVTNALTNLGAFYELVDNGPLSGRPLFSGTAFTKEWNARFILASTQPMTFEKSDSGWDRRCIPISTIAREDEINGDWAKKIEDCSSQVVSWVMGLDKGQVMDILRHPMKFALDYQFLKDLQSITSDSVQAFIDACLVPSGDVEPISKATVYGWYKAFCESNKLGAKGFTNFCSRMKSSLGDLFEIPRSSKRIGGKMINVAAQYQKMDLSSSALFGLKAMPSGEELPPERAEFVCNAVNQSEGGLTLFRSFVFTSIHSKKECIQEPETYTVPMTQEYQAQNDNFEEKKVNQKKLEEGQVEKVDLVYREPNLGETPESFEGQGFEVLDDRLGVPDTSELTPELPPIGTRVFNLTRNQWGVIKKIESDGWLRVAGSTWYDALQLHQVSMVEPSRYGNSRNGTD